MNLASRRIYFLVFGGLVISSTFLLSSWSVAQTAVDGAVAGTVVDSTGAILPKATVVIHSAATNADTKAIADESGYFRATRLVPGDYTVTVTADGFAKYTAEHVTVEVGKLTEVTPKLGAASASATVDVNGDTPLINTETSDFTTEFDPTALNTLPINGRHWTSFALLSPGVTLGNSAFGLVTFRGASNLANNFMVDGSDDNDSFDAVERGYTRVGYTTPEDAVLEFQVLTSNVPAQYGRAVGGGVNAVTKSGSNTLHGDLFEYYRDNDFGATNPYNTLAVTNTSGAVQTIYIKPKDKRHQYGGTVDGALIKDKLFFLYAFDQQRRNFPVLSVPTPQFLQASNASYNNCKVKGGTTTTDAITCAEDRGVPLADINQALAYIGGQSGVAPRLGDQIINFLKFDYALNPKNNASLIYDRMRWDSPDGVQTNPVIRRGITSIGNDFLKSDSVIGKIDTVITPTLTNEFRLNYARTFDTENGNTPLANEPNSTAGGLPPGLIISPNSGFSMGTPYYVPRSSYPDEREIDGVDNVTVVHGNQTFTTGGEIRWAKDNIVDVDYEHGLFTYSLLADYFTDFARTLGNTSGCDSARDTGTGTLPCYSNLQQAFGHPQFIYWTTDYAAYVQDDWKLTKKLTLNLGARYDYEKLPSATIPNPNPNNDVLLALTGQMPSDKNNISARLGVAYDIFGNGKTLLHAGFGMYYGRIQNGTIYKALATTGAPTAQFQLNSSPSTGPVYPVIVSSGNPPAVSNITAFAKNFQAPVADEFNFSVQQALPWKTVVGVAYLGSLGKQLPNFYDANIAPATTTKTYSFTGGPLAGDQWTVPVYTARLSPLYNAFTLIASNVTSAYNALAITLDHRLSTGVQFSASYTYSKALDYGLNQSSGADTNDPLDPYTVKPDYGRSVNDLPQRLVGNLIVSPKFALSNSVLSQVVNGWTLAPAWTLQSGLPYSYGLSSGTSIAGGSTTFNGAGGGNYVDFKAYPQYSATDVFNGSGAQRNTLRQAPIENVDTRLSRAFAFHEKYKLTLSTEAFNILNRQQFTAYNTTAYALSGTTGTFQGSFGTPSAAGNTIYRERQIQFVGRFEF